MKNNAIGGNMRLNGIGISLMTVAAAAVLFVSTVFASPNGPRNNYTGSPPDYNNCTLCHTSYPLNSGSGAINLTGLPTGGYTAGASYPLTLTISDPQAMRWGFQVTAVDPSGQTAGSLSVTDSVNTQWNDNPAVTVDIIMHTLTGTYAGTPGSASWDFLWTAPNNTDGATFHISSNAANNNNLNTGDYIYNQTVFVPALSAPSLDLDLTYNSGSPVPAGGGNLGFGVYLANSGTATLDFDAWIDIVYNQGAPTTVVQRSFTNYQPGWAVNRPDMFFPIPGSYAAGNYTFTGKAGTYGSAIWAWDGFPFEKSGDLDKTDFVPWIPDGAVNPFDDITESATVTPEEYALLGNHPNPFNPSTVIRFQLPQASRVTLQVFDIKGRDVGKTMLASYRNRWMRAGIYEVNFDASGLSSGVYFYRLRAGDFVAAGKMLLTR